MRHVALHVHLALLAVGRRRQRHHPEHARADALGDRLDGAALAGAVAPLEDDADLEALVHDPLLQLDQLDVQLGELLAVDFEIELIVQAIVIITGCLLVLLVLRHVRLRRID